MKQLRYLFFVLAASIVMSCGNNGGSGIKMKDVIGMQKWAGAVEEKSAGKQQAEEFNEPENFEEPEGFEESEDEYTEANGMPSWVYGKWTCTTPYGTENMWINKELILYRSANSEASGTYSDSKGTIRVTYSKENGVVTSMQVDLRNRRIEYGGGYYWQKLSN